VSRKVHPITGRHTTLSSMLAEAMADDRAKRGFVVYFEEDGTMHFGELGATVSDVCMAHGYIGRIVNQMMEQPE
jgi:hypothetical protein